MTMLKTFKKAVHWYVNKIEENNAFMPSCMVPVNPKL